MSNVEHPSHYAEGRKYEPIDVINDWELNFNLGNTIKYISRAGRKDNIVEDLKKAKYYLDYEIERVENVTEPKTEIEHKEEENCKHDWKCIVPDWHGGAEKFKCKKCGKVELM